METMEQNTVKRRDCYAVHTGDYVGQMFIVCEVTDREVGCLAVPDMKNVQVPNDKWTIGRNSAIIEYVEEMPKDVFRVCSAQYNENSNN
jgi:hypothetical protein